MINPQELMAKNWKVKSSSDTNVIAGDTLVFTSLTIEQWKGGTKEKDWAYYTINVDEITGLTTGGKGFHIKFTTPKQWTCSFSDASAGARHRSQNRKAVALGTSLGTLVGAVVGVAAGEPAVGLLISLFAALTSSVVTRAGGPEFELRMSADGTIVAEEGSGTGSGLPTNPPDPYEPVHPLRVAGRR